MTGADPASFDGVGTSSEIFEVQSGEISRQP
jgi:hypothetical protein